MATTLLGNKNVGDIIKIKEKGVLKNYIIVHQGLPASMYDNSCNGTWVLRYDLFRSNEYFDTSGGTHQYGYGDNDYANSDINKYLNDTVLNAIDKKIRDLIKNVKIPYRPGSGTSKNINSGANGLPTKIFLLSGYEVGWTTSTNQYLPVDGACLSYFLGTAETDSKRIAHIENSWEYYYWLRSPHTSADYAVFTVDSDGSLANAIVNSTRGVRPAFILPSDIEVNEDGSVKINTAPKITANKSGDLGTLTNGFDAEYSVNDGDGDAVTVTEKFDNANVRSYVATPDQTEAYSLHGREWLKTANGEHTFTISASDGEDTTEHSITFTRKQTSLFVMPETPFTADDNIMACRLKVEGSIPTDAVCKYEVTNNALDSSPTWEDCTEETKARRGHFFKSQGSAFNFRVSIKRGNSGKGGNITEITGGYE